MVMDVQHVSSELSHISDPIEAQNKVIAFKEELEQQGLSDTDIEAHLTELKDRIETRLLALNDSTDPSNSYRKAAKAARKMIRRITEMNDMVLVHLEAFGLHDPASTTTIPDEHARDIRQISHALSQALQDNDLGWVEDTCLAKGPTSLPEDESGYLTIVCSTRDADQAREVIRNTMNAEFADIEFGTSHS